MQHTKLNEVPVKSAGQVRLVLLTLSAEQKQSIKHIKEFIRSCVLAKPELNNTRSANCVQHNSAASTTPVSTSSSVKSNYSSVSSSGSKIKIYKGTIDQVLRKYFPSIDSTKFDIVSNEIFYYIQKQLHFNDTNQLTQNIINEMNGSLTQLTVDKRQHQLELSDSNTCRNLSFDLDAVGQSDSKSKGITPEDDSSKSSLTSVTDVDLLEQEKSVSSDQFEIPKRIPSNDSLTSVITDDLQQVTTLLTQLVDLNQHILHTFDQDVIDMMASDIYSTGFFNPQTLQDTAQRQAASAFIDLIKSDQLNLKKSAATSPGLGSLSPDTQLPNGKTHSSSTGAVVSQTVVSHSVSVKDFNDIGVQTDTYQADVSTTQGLAQSVFLTGVIGSAAFILSRYFNK